jgi:hypothetical protein
MHPMQPRAEDRPLCPEGDERYWATVGIAALGLVVMGCLAGVLPSSGSPSAAGPPPGLAARTADALALVAWVALCTAAGVAAFRAVALVHGRPAGPLVSIAARAFACAAVASMVQFVPVPGEAVKLLFDGLAFAAVAALLARPAFRVGALDAFATAAVATGIVAIVVGAAAMVTWAAAPR